MSVWTVNSGIAAGIQIASLVLIAVVVARSTISGRHLLITAAIWLLVVSAWVLLRSDAFYGVKFSGRHRTVAIAVIYFFLWTYQFLLFGWLIPLGVGIYRFMRR